MRRDPTAFRERFKNWKETGEYELPKFEDGYESFLKTLPDNLKTPGAYNTRRYWELNGKPKNFAEAIGRGMYAIQNDNGVLGWHANSVAYNESNDTYEFMKPNYHPTRWMELVEGYDKNSEFLKDWKVLYNGPMLSDRYVRREKPGLKVKGGQLPKFAGGTEGYKYVKAGKNNEWSRITNDDMSLAFLDLVVRPLSRGGNTTVGNWNRQWTPKYEKPLESISPEFDILSLGSGILKEAKRIGTFKQVVKEFTDDPDQIKYSLRDWKGDNKGYIAAHSYDNTPEIGFVKSDIPGGSRALYDAVIKDVTDRGMLGLYSGKELLSAPKTYSVWKHFKDKVLVGNNGLHSNMRMPGVTGEVKWSGDYNKMILNWQNNIYDGTNNGPVYLLKSPSLSLLTLPYIPNMTYLGIPIIGHTMSE